MHGDVERADTLDRPRYVIPRRGRVYAGKAGLHVSVIGADGEPRLRAVGVGELQSDAAARRSGCCRAGVAVENKLRTHIQPVEGQ